MRTMMAVALAAAAAVFPGAVWADPPAYVTVNPLGIELVLVRGGERLFYLSRFEVTCEQWARVMKSNPSRSQGCPDCPVARIGWADIGFFLSRANQLTRRNLRLPTESEWEYAASAGDAGSLFSGTSDPEAVGRFAWFSENSSGQSHPVGFLEPNAFGMYDMSGNVWEWCSAPTSAGVLKGGSWREVSDSLRIRAKADRDPDWRGKGCLPLPLVPARRQMVDVGFRVAMDAFGR